MGLPALLKPGLVSIYGLGQEGIADITLPPLAPNQTGLIFGVVNQIWDGFPLVVNQWDSVMFHTKDILASLEYQNQRYVLIEQDKILLTEITPP